MKKWFTIQAKSAGAAEILIFDEVGLFGIGAKRFDDQLKALGEVENILLRINSPGGDVFDGFAIYNMLKRHPARVDVVVDGIAASIASVIAMAGVKITMPENSMMLIHNPWGGVIGEADDMREMADALDKMKLGILAAYRRSGKSDEELSAIMNAETWLTAAEAVASGFADEVSEAVQIAAFFDLKKFQNPPAALQSWKPSPAAPAASVTEPQLTRGDHAVVANAAKIVEEQEQSTLRRSALGEAAAIAQACADAGHVDMIGDFLARGLTLDEVKAELAKPTNAATATATGSPDELKKIYSLCRAAGVVDLADQFASEGRTVAWVENRLQHASAIRTRCAAASHLVSEELRPSLRKRADDFIRANASPEEVSTVLNDLLVAFDGPEIDNSFMPYVTGHGSAPSAARKINYNEIYARYRAREGQPDGESRLAAKIAKAIREERR